MRTRPDTMDDYIIKEQPGSYGKLRLKGAVVLDLGGNIGAFANYAFEQGAVTCHSYEPDPDNFALLKENTEAFKGWVNYPQAVVRDDVRSVDYFKAPGKNQGCGSLHIKRGRESITVMAAPFETVLRRANFTCIKMDIEGGEYDLLPHDLPASVMDVAVEWHFGKKAWREGWRARHEDLLRQGFKVLTKVPAEGNKLWHSVQVYSR